MITVGEAKNILVKVVDKLEKSIEREDTYRRELSDDLGTLEYINACEADSVELPSDSPYESYDQWRESIQKEITADNNSINRIGVEKAELLAFNYFLENAED